MKLGRQIFNAMLAHRIAHHVEFLTGGDERVDKGELICTDALPTTAERL